MTPDDKPHPPEKEAASAGLTWDAHGRPFSHRFDDVYFSRDSGLDESRYVFIEQNQLPQRWANLPPHAHFVIGETGFGTGLNFLAAWDLWRRLAPSGARLHFVSVEKYPLARKQLQQALQLWPQLRSLANELIEAYPPQPAQGFHRLIMDKGDVTLTLIFDDALAGLRQLLPVLAPGPTVATSKPSWMGKTTKIDAWFLDGFAPSKNPDMWSQPLFQALARLSGTNTTFATFSAASRIKQGLPAVGFELRKVPGFGRKRDMLCGNFVAAESLPFNEPPQNHGWHLMAGGEESRRERHVLVIGGGLAGCQSARALAQRGYRVTLLEQARIASGASGNAQGVVYAKANNPGPLADFNLTALQFACRFYRTRIGYATCGALSGVVHVPQTEKQMRDYRALAARFDGEADFVRWLEPQQTEAECGLYLASGGLLFPQAGWLDPRQLCRQLLDHEKITCLEEASVEQLAYNQSHDQNQGQWQALGSEGILLGQAPQVVIASASDARKFTQTRHLPVKPIRGQVTEVAATPASRRLTRVLCGRGYIAPARDDAHCLGASFNLHDSSNQTRAADDRQNLDTIGDLSTSLGDWGEPLRSRVSFRCASPDYLPLVGAAPVAADFNRDFAGLRRNARAPIDATGRYYPGLFINIGHGSRGLAYTPLCAELLASLMDAEPLPLARDVVLRLHPARFLIRDLQRNKLQSTLQDKPENQP